MIMETKKSYNLLSASRRTRKTCGIIQYESEGLRTKKANGVGSQAQRPENQSTNVCGQKMDAPVKIQV